jgi:hypothetical protein
MAIRKILLSLQLTGSEARPSVDEATASFATVIGRGTGRYCSPPGEAGRFDRGAASGGR